MWRAVPDRPTVYPLPAAWVELRWPRAAVDSESTAACPLRFVALALVLRSISAMVPASHVAEARRALVRRTMCREPDRLHLGQSRKLSRTRLQASARSRQRRAQTIVALARA